MHDMKSHWISRLTACALALMLTACATPQRMYEWGGYQDKVYEHFKGQGAGPEQQILGLEEDLQRMSGKGMAPPPGYYGHLGLLYLTTGKSDQAAQAWNKEKALFPESTQYMDFLLNNMKKQKG